MSREKLHNSSRLVLAKLCCGSLCMRKPVYQTRFARRLFTIFLGLGILQRTRRPSSFRIYDLVFLSAFSEWSPPRIGDKLPRFSELVVIAPARPRLIAVCIASC